MAESVHVYRCRNTNGSLFLSLRIYIYMCIYIYICILYGKFMYANAKVQGFLLALLPRLTSALSALAAVFWTTSSAPPTTIRWSELDRNGLQRVGPWGLELPVRFSVQVSGARRFCGSLQVNCKAWSHLRARSVSVLTRNQDKKNTEHPNALGPGRTGI